ncbi:MAG: T9SS type A sorting domain-containing protein [Candidatus Cloacimonadales bacterium]|nr:T9SS type A sorting domain-containing protein [Candidatus Cloacimonadales bacterium]
MKKFLSVALLLIPVLGFSQIQWQNNGIPVRCGENINWQGETVNTSEGNFVLVWSDSRNGSRGIFAQKVTPDGALLWGQTGIEINDETFSQHHPKAIATENNEVIIAWHCIYSFAEKEVRVQKLDAFGNKLWAEEGVSVIIDSEIDYDVHIIDDQNGGVFVLWMDYQYFGWLKGQHVLADGSIDSNWNAGGNGLAAANGGYLFNAISDGTGGFIFSWESSSDLSAQKVDANGNLLWGDEGIVICDGTVNNQYSSFVCDFSGNSYFFWNDYRNSNESIYMQKINDEGIIQFTEDVLVYTSTIDVIKINSIFTTDDNLAVSWIEHDYNQAAIKTIKLDTMGNLFWNALSITEDSDIYWYNIQNMLSDNDGGYWLKWFDSDGYADLFVQHVTSSGEITLTANGFLICDDAGSRTFMAMNLTTDNRVFLSWHDGREGTSSLYIQNVDDQGNLLFPVNGQAVYEGSAVYCRDLRILPNNDNPIFIWLDQNSYFNQRIFMQSLNPDGSLIFDEAGIMVIPSEWSLFADFDWSSLNDNYAIISRTDDNNYFTRAKTQSFDSSGNLLWGEEGIFVTNSDWEQYNVQLSSSEGFYYAGWTEYNGDWFNPVIDIFAQKLDENGNLLWNEAGVEICNGDGDDILQCILGSCYVWQNESWPEYKIYAKLVDENGYTAPGWGENGTAISNAGFMNYSPEGLQTPQGYLILWKNSFDSQCDIWGQIITEEGNILWQQGGLPLVDQPNDQVFFKFQFDEFLYLVWQDYRSGTQYEIYAQKFDENGSELWQTGGVLVGEGCNPDIEKNGNQLLVVWEKQNEENFEDIYIQLLSLDGEIQWNPEGEVICDAFWWQKNPQIVKNENNDVYIGWLDDRVFNEDLEGGDYMTSVFAQKFHIEPTYTPDDILNAITAKLHQNYPNPFNPSTTISFNLSNEQNEQIELVIYNLKGQKVKVFTFPNGSLGTSEQNLPITQSPNHQIVWDGTDDNNKPVSSGIYFYKLKSGNFEKTKKMLLIK